MEILKGSKKDLSIEQAEYMIENVVGLFSMPLGIATHFLINGRNHAIPMVVEETSIIAAASAAAKWVHRNNGFQTRSLGKLIIGQIQFPTLKNPDSFVLKIASHQKHLLELANQCASGLKSRGGGIKSLEIRKLDRPDGSTMAVVHILCDPCDAMGANLINQVCEALKPTLEKLTDERIGLCILSNLADQSLVEAKCEISDISEELGKAIEEAVLFANLDPYRAATHNKGVLNGIDAVLLATGNDWRAVEAGSHTYALTRQNTRSLTDWQYKEGKLYGRIQVPLSVGTVGGMTRIHPTARLCLKILGVHHSEELAQICAAVGLAQNLAALRALCSEGIVQGHMRLHLTNFAFAAGATPKEIKLIQSRLKDETRITFKRTQELLAEIRSQV